MKTTLGKLIHGAVGGACLLGLSAGAQAAVTMVEGAAGSGIVPWALLSGGKPTGAFTYIDVGDFRAFNIGFNASFADRVEVSVMRDVVDLGANDIQKIVSGVAGEQTGNINFDILGVKVKLVGMTDTLPQIAIGAYYKRTDLDKDVVNVVNCGTSARAFGGTCNDDDDSGWDAYVAATKVFPVGSKKVLLNLALQYGKGNQLGILGFSDESSIQVGLTAGYFIADNLVFGFDYRWKPDESPVFKEDDWWDIWMAWFPDKNVAITAAYANLGDIVKEAADLNDNGAFDNSTSEGKDQQGLYLQFQINFDLF
ncbi:MAG: DUF3034 family protein [Chromatiales bacterium]|nr:DUF3034 family protein [Chromatiales bacterium]